MVVTLRKKYIALAIVLFIVLQMTLWNHSEVIWSYRQATRFKELDAFTSTNTCSVHVASAFKINMDSFIKTIHSIIPDPSGFLRNYTNPCWYMHLSASENFQKMLISKRGNLTDMEASDFMSKIFDSEEDKPKELVCIPKIYFIGFPKCGSSQLHSIIVRHPQVIQGTGKEPKWWSRFPYSDKYPHNVLAVVHYLLYYKGAADFIKNHSTAMTIDSTTSTVWDVRFTGDSCIIPSLISSVVPGAKYIVIMREPASRLLSDFFMVCRDNKTAHYTENTQDIFNNASELAVQYFKRCTKSHPLDVCTYNALWKVTTPCGPLRLGISLYYVHMAKWLKVIPKEKMLFLRTEDLQTDPYSVMQSIWTFLDLPVQSVQELKRVLYRHTNINPLSKVAPVEMKPETMRMLKKFFHPYNKKLAMLLEDDKFLWKDSE